RADEARQRREEVDLAERRVDHAAGGLSAGEGDRERHPEDLVVERLSVEQPAVIEGLLAVVGREDDDRAVEAAAPEAGEERAERAVVVPDLAAVLRPQEGELGLRQASLLDEPARVADAAVAAVPERLPVRVRRLVGIVGVEGVQVEEVGLARAVDRLESLPDEDVRGRAVEARARARVPGTE